MISGTHFRVHSQALRWSSQVFKDMLEIGEPEGGKEVHLTESADTLEKALIYIYPRSLPEFKLELPECLVVIRALHKYEVRIQLISSTTLRAHSWNSS